MHAEKFDIDLSQYRKPVIKTKTKTDSKKYGRNVEHFVSRTTLTSREQFPLKALQHQRLHVLQ